MWEETENERAVTEVAKNGDANERTQTPRLRAAVDTPGETGVGRPDGRKPEAGKGAGPGSGGVTGNPVAEMEMRKTIDM